MTTKVIIKNRLKGKRFASLVRYLERHNCDEQLIKEKCGYCHYELTKRGIKIIIDEAEYQKQLEIDKDYFAIVDKENEKVKEFIAMKRIL